MGKTKAHIRYRTADGAIVPGVTTVLGILNKPALVPWANKLGLQGIDVKKFVDDKADIGMLGHAFVTDHLAGKETDTSDYSQNQIDKAENSALSFWNWEKDHKIEHIFFVEEPLISEQHRFGGTQDIYCRINGKAELEQARKEAAEKAAREAEEKAKRDAEEKAAREQAEREEAARQEAIRPDKEKLLKLAEAIEVFELPTLKNKKPITILTAVKDRLNDTARYLREEVGQLTPRRK